MEWAVLVVTVTAVVTEDIPVALAATDLRKDCAA
jgi:hypothetical protein